MTGCARACRTCRFLTGAPPMTVCTHGDYLGWATHPDEPACRGRAWEPQPRTAPDHPVIPKAASC